MRRKPLEPKPPADEKKTGDKKPVAKTAEKKAAAEPKAESARPVARVCSENDRATAGLTRFKIRGIDCDRPWQGTSSPGQASARTCYLEAEKLPSEVMLSCQELPD